MTLSKILRNIFLVITACLVLSACATKKVSVSDLGGQIQGDVYVGSDTVEYLASVFQTEFSLQRMNQF